MNRLGLLLLACPFIACGGGSKGDSTAATGNPCAANPCDADPCGDNPCNPCEEANPCAEASEGSAIDWTAWQSWPKVSAKPFPSKDHKQPWVSVYVTDAAAYRAGGEMTEGFAAVKSAHKDVDGKPGDVAMLTVMAKMGSDYDPENGNWYYAAMSADGSTAMKEGKLEACIGCHSTGDDYLFSSKVP